MEGDDKLVDDFARAQESLVLQAADLSLRTIADMVDSYSIDVAPEYQRRMRWTPEKQSALIESLLINVPIPPIYLSEDEYGRYSVIDGRQRITAIHEFLNDKLVLRGLENLPELNGRKFSQLPNQLARTLIVRPFIRSITLLKQSDPSLKYEVFTRLNTGGERLNQQEVRNAAYGGELNDLIYKLADHEFLKQQLKINNANSHSYRAMVDAEYVLRFLTLREHWKTFSGNLASSMDEFMHANRDPSPHRLTELRERFLRAIGSCESIWGEHAFRRPNDKDTGWRDQTLAGMYDAQMVAVDIVSDEHRDAAQEDRIAVLQETRNLFGSADFEKAVRQATNTPSSVRLRVSTVRDLLLRR